MKKKYSQPKIEKVQLVPSEAVLGACKTAQSSGPGFSCYYNVAPCSAIGS